MGINKGNERKYRNKISVALEDRLHGIEIEVEEETKDVQANMNGVVEVVEALMEQMELMEARAEVQEVVDTAPKRLGEHSATGYRRSPLPARNESSLFA